MRPLLALACLALVTATLAGCADDPERYPDGVPTTSATATQTHTVTGGSTTTTTNGTGAGGRTGQAPTGSINVAINGTNASFQLDGSDADGDAVNWTLDFGDGATENGTALPATVNHTYALGNYTANFTLEAGGQASSYNASLAITAGGGGGSSKQTQVVTGGTLLPNPAGNDAACIGDDVDGNTYDLDPAGPGWTYVLEPGDGTFGAYFYDSGGAFLSGGTEGTGEVPDDAASIEICNVTGAPMTDYTVTLTEP